MAQGAPVAAGGAHLQAHLQGQLALLLARVGVGIEQPLLLQPLQRRLQGLLAPGIFGIIIVLLDSWGKFSRIGDANRIKKWLETQGVENIKNVNEAIKPAHPWFSFYGAKSADELA